MNLIIHFLLCALFGTVCTSCEVYDPKQVGAVEELGIWQRSAKRLDPAKTSHGNYNKNKDLVDVRIDTLSDEAQAVVTLNRTIDLSSNRLDDIRTRVDKFLNDSEGPGPSASPAAVTTWSKELIAIAKELDILRKERRQANADVIKTRLEKLRWPELPKN